MQECRDIFVKIEISAGMWKTHKNTHFKLPTKSQTPKLIFLEPKIRCLKQKKSQVLLFLGSVGHFFVFFFFLLFLKKK